MITFEAIDAGHGDAILIRYKGGLGFERILLIDAGPDSTGSHNGPSYKPLTKTVLPRLMEIKAERDAKSEDEDIKAGEPELTLDLVVCTHVHDDHIDGIVRLFSGWSNNGGMPAGAEQIKAPRLWHNSFSKIVGDVDIDAATAKEAIALSVPDGENLSVFANTIGTDINKGADGKLIAPGFQPKGFGPAKITVLNPGKEELEDLKKEWAKAAKKKAAADGETQALGELDLKEFQEDNSILNLSSITMLIEWEGRRILLTGDQRGDFVLRSLEALGLKETDKPFHVDILKVPHHGSKANVQKKFIAGVIADTYVFSANGRDQNPDPEVLEIVAHEAKKGRKFTMAFTNQVMNYMPDKKGNNPKFVHGPSVATLGQALDFLKSDPDVAANITFEFREAGAHSLVYTLTPKT
jgi:beta-lactamase superfamily II metal-dependent hydrolase